MTTSNASHAKPVTQGKGPGRRQVEDPGWQLERMDGVSSVLGLIRWASSPTRRGDELLSYQ